MPAPQTEVLITVDGVEHARHTVAPGDYVIGCKKDCHFRVDAHEVSHEHAKLIVNYDHALIEDLGSGSGTFVNGELVKDRTRLWPSQKIRVGAATVTLRRLQGEQPSDMSLAPAQQTIRRMLPAELLREKKYNIGGVVARGGMGAILDAREAAIERKVAMKVMLDTNDADAVSRFIAEAKVTGQLEHPNVVPVHELSVDENGQPYYTMKMVKGVTLKHVIEQLTAGDAETLKKYPLPALLTIFQKVCDAIAFAHSKGVIHRDLKPENIMVGDYGEALVMDWGLAKVLGVARAAKSAGPGQEMRSFVHKPSADGDTGSRTMSGTVMGTPQFMSPEQARGEVDELDARSDIYSLGAILYQILALRVSVSGTAPWEMVGKVGRGEIDPLTAPQSAGGKAKSAIPESLAAVVKKAMAFEPATRYASVADLQRDILAYQTGFATSAEKAGILKQVSLLIKRNKGIFTTAAAAWLLITALAVWFVVNLRAKERRAVAGEQSAIASTAEAKAETQRATRAEADAVQEKEAARHSLAKAALNFAEAAQREGNGPGMQAALNEVPDDLRDSTWNYLFEQSDTSIANIRTDTSHAAPHPRLPGVFALGEGGGKVTVLDIRTGQHLLEFMPTFQKKSSSYPLVAFSPDGERIAVGWGAPAGIVIHSARDGKKLLEWEAPGSANLSFSPDGKLLFQTDRKRIHVWDATDGKPMWSYPAEDGAHVWGVFSADGQQLVTFDDKEQLRLVNARDGSLVRPWPKPPLRVDALLRQPDGTIVAGGEHGLVLRLDPRDGHVIFDFRAGGEFNLYNIALTPDGTRLAVVTKLPDGRQDIRVWDMKTAQPVQSLLGGIGDVRDVTVHPLSGELVVCGPNTRAWNLTGTAPKWTFSVGFERSAFFGSDELVLTRASGSDGPALARLQAGIPAVLWKDSNVQSTRATVSADGRFAATCSPGGGTVVILRNPGPAMEQVTSFPWKASVYFLRLSPTGDRILVGNSNLELHSTATGGLSVALERSANKKAFASMRDIGWLSEQRLVGLVSAGANRGNPGSEESIVLWDTATGKVLRTTANRTAMDVLAVAPDGRRFAEAGTDRLVRIRDAETLAVVQEFRAHDGPITALAWHPTKPIMATASADLSVRLWDLETGRRLEEFRGLNIAPYFLTFSPGGQRLACSAKDATRIWEPKSLNDQPDPDKAAGWEDLLAPLTPDILAQTGHGWRMNGGALFSPGAGYETLPLPGNLSSTSYTVRVKLRQLTAKEVFHLELPVADQMVGFDLDGFPKEGFYTGLNLVKGKKGKDLPGIVGGKQVKDSEQHDLEVTVRLDGANATITTTLDDQPLYEWTGPTADLSPLPNWKTPPGTLALGTNAADWVVYEVKVKRLEK